MASAAPSTLFLIVISTLYVSSEADLSGSCDMTRCGSPQTLIGAKEEIAGISIEETSAKIIEWPEKEPMIWGVRRRQTKYCTPKNDFVADNCKIEKKNYHINTNQAREYLSNGQCWTGCDCDSKTCWGADSDCCLSDDLTVSKGPTQIPIFEHYRAGWHYTCTSHWECRVEKIEVDTHMVVDGMTYKRVATLIDKRTVVLDEKFYSQGEKYDDGTSVNTVARDPPNPIVASTKAKCYSSSKENILCLTKIDDKEIPIEINYVTMTGVVRSKIVQITGRIHTIEQGQLAYITPGTHGYGSHVVVNQDDVDDRAVSISSLKEVIVGVKILQLQEIYNTISNGNQIKRVISLMTNLVAFLSQKFPLLLSQITKGDFKTKWVNQDVFLTCPCMRSNGIPYHTNCHNGKIHQDGELSKITDKSMCFSIGDVQIKNISLIDNANMIDHEIIDYLPPKTASSDDPIWDKIYQDRYSTVGSESNDVDYDKIRDFVSSLNPIVSFKDALLYFSAITSLVYVIQALSVRR